MSRNSNEIPTMTPTISQQQQQQQQQQHKTRLPIQPPVGGGGSGGVSSSSTSKPQQPQLPSTTTTATNSTLRNPIQQQQLPSSSSSSSASLSHHQPKVFKQPVVTPTTSATAVTSSTSTTTTTIIAAAAAVTSSSTSSSSTSTSHAYEKTDYRIFENIEYPFCSDVSKYEKIMKIGQGTFGEVYKAKVKSTHKEGSNEKNVPDKLVALKKVLTDNEKEGFPITALREIKILTVLRHENIVHLIEICTSRASAQNNYKSQFYLVFEFCDHDLAGLLSNTNVRFTLSEMKKIMQQLLNGLFFIHKNHILHRDMKTANILVTKEGVLKLADFGLARAIDTQLNRCYTNRVVTLWYRPPELLLGERNYTSSIDIWGAGCIMAELWTRSPIMQGNTEQHQIFLITQLCGSIEPSVWPNVEKLELYNRLQLRKDLKRSVKERMQSYVKDQYALDLLDRLLTLDPNKRIDSDEALNHDFFWTDPLPTDLKLDKYAKNMYEFTVPPRRAQVRAPPSKPAFNQQHFDRVY